MSETDNYQPFPRTQFSAIEGLKSDRVEIRTRAFDRVVSLYWKPVYKYVRVKYRQTTEDAEDLTQGFFAKAFEKEYLAGFDATKGRFRTFLRTCLDRFAANVFKAGSRLKRGGDTQTLSLDFGSAERELQQYGAASSNTVEAYFDREWVRSVLSQSVESLKRKAHEQGKEVHFTLFEQYDLYDGTGDKQTYQQLAEQYGLPVTDVTNYLADMRRQFRSIVLEIIREITESEDEFKEEVRAVLGISIS